MIFFISEIERFIQIGKWLGDLKIFHIDHNNQLGIEFLVRRELSEFKLVRRIRQSIATVVFVIGLMENLVLYLVLNKIQKAFVL